MTPFRDGRTLRLSADFTNCPPVGGPLTGRCAPTIWGPKMGDCETVGLPIKSHQFLVISWSAHLHE